MSVFVSLWRSSRAFQTIFLLKCHNIFTSSNNCDNSIELISTIRIKFPKKMENITSIRYGPLPKDSPYVKPFRLYYTQNGEEKNWDLLKVHDSVAVILFNKTNKTLLFVKQFRPAVYHSIISSHGMDDTKIDLKKFPPKLGVTLELCAGIVDKEISLADIAKEEIYEECGYDVPSSRIEEILTYRAGVGTSGALQTMFYCEVTDEDKVASGGGVDGEIIEVVEFTIDEAQQLVSKGASVVGPPSFLLGVLWFLTNKALPKAQSKI